ncbi:Multiple RNA-binding domain-containing protein 1 [Smittium mucronatum]|uniref:Multiple RNA-binding domain-containing protein 1 n=1 Tax=Smittium mucronatum TaxID=133383 RepID=A0A1R0H9C2_9FUNG|nr:Multiple RNA-binding domain-containing protein 1 [Smittium mucronatum]
MSSRIIVKNLPKRYSEERMKEHFSEKGSVTDVKIMKNLKGDTRRFGFVGYKSEKEAKAAVRFFNGTFIDTSKIIVEFAKPIGDPQIPRAWSSYTKAKDLFNKREIDDAANASRVAELASSDTAATKDAPTASAASVLQTLYEETVAQNANDPQFQEFLQVMAPRAKSKTWANDDINLLNEREKRAVSNAISHKKASESAKNKAPSALPKAKVQAKVLSVPNKKPGGASLTVSKTHITFDIDEENENGAEEIENEAQPDDFDVNSGLKNLDDEKLPASLSNLSSDMEWLRSHIKSTEPEAKEPDLESDVAATKDEPAAVVPVARTSGSDDVADKIKYSLLEKEKERQEHISRIADSGRLFVRNLPYDTSENSLRNFFEKYGPLSEIHMPIDNQSKKPKGFAYVLYLLPENAVKAFKSSDHQFFQGRHLHILPADDKPSNPNADNNNDSSSLYGDKNLKKQKESARKKNAGNDFNWNSLYMSADAVADSIAERLQIDKMDLLSSESGSPAVRLALAETHIISETKKFFEVNGIVLDSFNQKTKTRSDTVILVKNIPFSVGKLADFEKIASEGSSQSASESIENEIRALFGVHGTLGRVLVPPARTIAIVEFLEPSEARSAFRHLAYKRFGDAPLYLEWAPEKLFRLPFDPKVGTKQVAEKSLEKTTEPDASSIFEPSAPKEEDDTGSNDVGSVLFVKNLNFETGDDKLKKVFESYDGFRQANVKYRNRKLANGETEKLSMGFGFVEFNSSSSARLALAALREGPVVDGHKLEVKMSDKKGTKAKGETKTSRVSTKLVVKNVPFEATKHDLRELFGTYGQLKSVRLPNKFSGGHRGFAFLEFLTSQEAANCLEQVGTSSHLYGRRLVVKWADEEPGLDGSGDGDGEEDEESSTSAMEGALEKLRKKSTRKFLGTLGENQNLGQKEKKIRLD